MHYTDDELKMMLRYPMTPWDQERLIATVERLLEERDELQDAIDTRGFDDELAELGDKVEDLEAQLAEARLTPEERLARDQRKAETIASFASSMRAQ